MTSIQLDGEVMYKAIQKAILDSFGEAEKELLLNKAVDYLTNPGPARYGILEPSPIEEIFRQAIREAAEAYAHEFINNPKQKKRIEDALQAGFMKFISDEIGFTQCAAKAFSEALFQMRPGS